MEVDTEAQNQTTKGQCSLVWEGASTPIIAATNKKRTFDKWKLVDIRSDAEARRTLNEKNMAHLWSMVLSYKPERAIGEEPEDIKKLLV